MPPGMMMPPDWDANARVNCAPDIVSNRMVPPDNRCGVIGGHAWQTVWSSWLIDKPITSFCSGVKSFIFICMIKTFQVYVGVEF